MTFDVIVHKDLSLNDVMYVIEHGKVCCLELRRAGRRLASA